MVISSNAWSSGLSMSVAHAKLFMHQEFSAKPSGWLNGNPSIIGCPRKKMRSVSKDTGKVGSKSPETVGAFLLP